MSKSKKTKQHPHKHAQATAVKGQLEVTRSGIGYVVISDGSGDILVRQGDFNTALHGDTVRVKSDQRKCRYQKKRRKDY